MHTQRPRHLLVALLAAAALLGGACSGGDDTVQGDDTVEPGGATRPTGTVSTTVPSAEEQPYIDTLAASFEAGGAEPEEAVCAATVIVQTYGVQRFVDAAIAPADVALDYLPDAAMTMAEAQELVVLAETCAPIDVLLAQDADELAVQYGLDEETAQCLVEAASDPAVGRVALLSNLTADFDPESGLADRAFLALVEACPEAREALESLNETTTTTVAGGAITPTTPGTFLDTTTAAPTTAP